MKELEIDKKFDNNEDDILEYFDTSKIRMINEEPKRVNIDFFEDVPVITFLQEPLTDIVNQMLKRAFDVVFSFLVIVLLYDIVALVDIIHFSLNFLVVACNYILVCD